jgi:hypothetical protein
MERTVNIEALVDTYCLAWSHPVEATRAKLLSSVWQPDACYTDPNVHVGSADQLLAHIATVQGQRPGSKVARTTAVQLHHRLARFGWHAVDAQGVVLREGVDVVFLSMDGARIERIIGFFDPIGRMTPAPVVA